MLKKNIILLVLFFIVGFIGCTTIGGKKENTNNSISEGNYIIPVNHNFEFKAFNSNIDNPLNDRRCYYKIFIDKVEMGRTTTGLESQEKNYETRLTENKHLLTIEKWVLNKKKGEYEKVNNIEQPKPSFFYFRSYGSKIVSIDLSSAVYGKAEYSVEYLTD